MNPKDQQSKNEYQKILKKIQSQSKQKKQQRAFNIMKGETAKNKSYQQINIIKKLQKYFENRQTDVYRYFRVKQNRHTAIITCFLVFSSYLCWIVQKKYDILKKKAQRTQTYKQRQVQKQNEYIERMLKKKQFQSVPIPNQLEQQNTYKFEQDKKTRGGFVIDTKQDLMDLIKKDNRSQKTPHQLYEEELKKNRQRI